MTYVQPTFDGKAFHCPLCGTYAHQIWFWMYYHNGSTFSQLEKFKMSRCTFCGQSLFWHGTGIIVPPTSSAPMPHKEMPAEVRSDYEEARSIFDRSARSASALLRLAVQKLCTALGEKSENLNGDIASLVRKGLPPQVQQALDVVRVVGNNQVHPGVLDVRDNPEVAIALFGLVNLIIEVMIAQPKHVKDMFSKLPESARKAIEQRDNVAKKGS